MVTHSMYIKRQSEYPGPSRLRLGNNIQNTLSYYENLTTGPEFILEELYIQIFLYKYYIQSQI